MSGSEEYNGWANRETWAVVLHLSNDEGLWDQSREVARSAAESWESPFSPGSALVRGDAEDAVQEYVEQLLDPGYWWDEFGSPMPEGIELMKDDCGSLWRVDWAEVAASLLAE